MQSTSFTKMGFFLVFALAMTCLAHAEPPPALKIKPNLAYGQSPAQKLDLYHPKNKKKCPIMIYVHGGGWRKGDKKAVGAKAEYFVKEGWVFISLNYRLLPEGRHPVNVLDIATAIAWIHKKTSTEGSVGSPDQLFLMGHSAGCHLVSLVATDHRYLKFLGHDLSIIKGVIANDTQAYEVAPLVKRGIGLYKQVFSEDPKTQHDASPIHHVAKGKSIPPFLIMYSKGLFKHRNNPLRPLAAKQFAEKLKEASIPAQIIAASDLTHSEINQMIGKPEDKALTPAIMTFLNEILKNQNEAE